ncbi:hypothetical protein J6590_074930 [Homalodisca vitripennis]|nr:hypothetical protein J6590_074930 [Homalodisca vitripennis]
MAANEDDVEVEHGGRGTCYIYADCGSAPCRANKLSRYQAPPSMPSLSRQSWRSVVLSWASSVSGTRKSHRGPDLGNTVAAVSLVVVFGQEVTYKQRCVSRGVIVVQKSIFVFSQIRVFLVDCFAHNLQVIFLIHRSTLWQELMMHHAPAIEENCKQNFHIRPNLACFFRSWFVRVWLACSFH